MDLRTTQLKDTYGNLVTTGTTAGAPTSGGLQNGQGTLLTGVGIGTDSPAFTNGSGLEVERAGIATLRLQNTSTAKATEIIQDTNFEIDTLNSGMDIILDATTDTIFEIANSEIARINSTGLGIGTTSPANGVSGLHISVASSSDQLYLERTGSATGRYYLGAAANSLIIVDDAQSAERMRIDSSGNVLVGKTATGLGNQGAELSATGQLKGTADNQVVAYLNRTSSDGTIAEFRKDNTTVGSIGTKAGDLTIGDADVGIRFDTGTGLVPWNVSTNLATDNAIDIGASSARFKDLYLGGSVYLGGTTSANALDDYEEGTFDPIIVGSTTPGTPTYSHRSGNYTKIGDLVHFNLNVVVTNWTGSPAGEVRIGDLPFVSELGQNSRGYAPITTYVTNYSGYTFTQNAYVQQNSDYIRFGDLPDASADTAFEIRLAGTYKTDS